MNAYNSSETLVLHLQIVSPAHNNFIKMHLLFCKRCTIRLYFIESVGSFPFRQTSWLRCSSHVLFTRPGKAYFVTQFAKIKILKFTSTFFSHKEKNEDLN